MNVGFDYFKTITEHPIELAQIAMSLKKSGHNIFVISAVSNRANAGEYTQIVKDFLKEIGFPDEVMICLVTYQYTTDIARLKLAECQKHKIRVFIDDRDDVCILLKRNGIATLKSTTLQNNLKGGDLG